MSPFYPLGQPTPDALILVCKYDEKQEAHTFTLPHVLRAKQTL